MTTPTKQRKTSDPIERVKADIRRYATLKGFAASDGGQLLLEAMQQDIAGTVNLLAGTYKTASHAELLASIAKLDSLLSLMKAMTRADDNLTLAEAYLAELAG